jgi:hypothetical protein
LAVIFGWAATFFGVQGFEFVGLVIVPWFPCRIFPGKPVLPPQ